MFVATASLAVQRLMIEIFSSWPVCALVSLCLVGWVGLAWRLRAAPRWLKRLAIALLMLRLAVPVLAVAGEGVHWAILERTYRPHAAQLAAYEGAETGAAGASKPTTGENRESLLDKMKSLLAQGGDIARQVESLRTRAQDIVENLARLAAVFTVQTLVLPLLYLGFLVWLYRTLTSQPPHPAGRSAGAPS